MGGHVNRRAEETSTNSTKKTKSAKSCTDSDGNFKSTKSCKEAFGEDGDGIEGRMGNNDDEFEFTVTDISEDENGDIVMSGHMGQDHDEGTADEFNEAISTSSAIGSYGIWIAALAGSTLFYFTF